MKSITLLTFSFFFFTASIASHNFLRDTTPPNINKFTKEQFLNKYATDETSKKLIRYYYATRKSAKQSLYFFPALTVLAGIYTAILSTESYPDPSKRGYNILAIFAAGYVGVMFLALSIIAVLNRKKYAPEKLYNKIMEYQGGKPLSKKLKRKIQYF